MENEQNHSRSTTRHNRRGGLVRLAFVPPAVVAALHGGVAFADTGTKTGTNTGTNTGTKVGTHTGTHAGDDHNLANTTTGTSTTNTGTGTGTSTRGEVSGLDTLLNSKLSRVSANADQLDKGQLKLFGVNNLATKLFVRLREALPNTSYRVVFVHGQTNAVTVLATILTDAEGDVRHVLTINPSFDLKPLFDASGRLVGQFYLQRDLSGSIADQFVARKVKVED